MRDTSKDGVDWYRFIWPRFPSRPAGNIWAPRRPAVSSIITFVTDRKTARDSKRGAGFSMRYSPKATLPRCYCAFCAAHWKCFSNFFLMLECYRVAETLPDDARASIIQIWRRFKRTVSSAAFYFFIYFSESVLFSIVYLTNIDNFWKIAFFVR